MRETRVELYRARAARKPGPSDFDRAFSSCRMRDSAGGAGAVAVVAAAGGGSDGDGAAGSGPLVVDGASEEAVVAVPKTTEADVGGLNAAAAAAAAAVTIPDGIATVGTETEVGVPALESAADAEDEVEVVRLYKNAEKAVLPGA